MSDLWDTFIQYLGVYKTTAIRGWENLTPTQYLGILMLVATIGFFWMASKKRA